MITNTDSTIRQIEFELEKAEHGLAMPYDAERSGNCARCWWRYASGNYRPGWQQCEGATGGTRHPECHSLCARPTSAPASTRTDRTIPSIAASGKSAASIRPGAVPTVCAGSGR